MMFTSKLRPRLSAKTGGIARLAIAAGLLSLTAHSSWALTNAQLLKAIAKHLPVTTPPATSPTAAINAASYQELDDAVLAAITADRTEPKAASVSAFVTAALNARTDKADPNFAVPFATGLNVAVNFEGLVARAAIKVSLDNANAIASGIAGKLTTAQLPSYTATAIGAVNNNAALIAQVATAVASSQDSTTQVSIAAAVVKATPLKTQKAAATAVTKSLEVLLGSQDQAAFANLLAKSLPTFASQIAVGAAVINPTALQQIVINVATANNTTIKGSSIIAGTLSRAANIEASSDIALALGGQFSNPLVLAQAPAIAKQLASGIAAHTVSQFAYHPNATLQDEAAAIASILAGSVPNAAATGKSITSLVNIAVQIINVNKTTKKFNRSLGAFDSLIVGTIAKTIKTDNDPSVDLTAFYKTFQSKLIAALVPAGAVKAAITAVINSQDSYQTGNFLNDETPIING